MGAGFWLIRVLTQQPLLRRRPLPLYWLGAPINGSCIRTAHMKPTMIEVATSSSPLFAFTTNKSVSIRPITLPRLLVSRCFLRLVRRNTCQVAGTGLHPTILFIARLPCHSPSSLLLHGPYSPYPLQCSSSSASPVFDSPCYSPNS